MQVPSQAQAVFRRAVSSRVVGRASVGAVFSRSSLGHYVSASTLCGYRNMKEGEGRVPTCFFFSLLFGRYWTLTCTCYYLGQLEQSSGPEPEAATEAVSPIDKLYKIVNSLAEKMQSFSKTSDKADSATEEMADILTSWNRDFVKLKPHEHALLSNRIASTPGVLNSFLSLADTLLPGKHCAALHQYLGNHSYM